MAALIYLLASTLTPALTAVEEDGLFKWCVYDDNDRYYELLLAVEDRCPDRYVELYAVDEEAE